MTASWVLGTPGQAAASPPAPHHEAVVASVSDSDLAAVCAADWGAGTVVGPAVVGGVGGGAGGGVGDGGGTDGGPEPSLCCLHSPCCHDDREQSVSCGP